MTNAGSAEVSRQIRAAIKAKLEELRVYVDEELPDYIMVMIANKKEKAQMKEDLLLFLGKNSGKFVDWLFDMFERLQSAGSAESSQTTSEVRRSEKESAERRIERKELERNRKKDSEETEKKQDSRKHSAERAKERDYERSKAREREREKARESFKKESSRQDSKTVKSRVTHREDKSPQSSHHKKAEETESHIKAQTHSSGETTERKSRRTQHVSKAEVRVNENRKVEHLEKSKSNESKKTEQAESSSKSVEQHVEHKRSTESRRAEKSSKMEMNVVDRRTKETETKINEQRRNEEKATDRKTKRPAEEKAVHSGSRKKRAVEPSAEHLPAYDSDEEARLAELESSKELANKKVQSTAIAKLATSPPAKTVSSQIIVKRKLPEKEFISRQARGVKSLFLKAIKDAGETTRSASQNAGYGGVSKVSPSKNIRKDERPAVEEEEEAIEIDVEDDIGDALVVVAPEERSKQPARSVVNIATDECKSEAELIKPSGAKRRRVEAPKSSSVEGTKFIITLSGDASGRTRNKRKSEEMNAESKRPSGSRKRRNEANPILSHLNISQRTNLPAKETTSTSSREDKGDELVVADNTENESRIVTSREDSWGLQIQLPDEDSSDDDADEAEIDAVLASTQASKVAFDEIPPTPTLSKASYRQDSAFHDGSSQNIFTINRQASNLVSAATETIMERCKFWPNCTLSKCVYIHPSKPCSNFPKCAFGNRCIYLHPKCKFDQSCLNPNCIFTHSPKTSVQSSAVTKTATVTKAATSTATAPATTVAAATTEAAAATESATPPTSANGYNSTSNSNIPCKFGRNCANSSCSYKHPKLCRFGSNCRNRSCYFWHPKACALAVLGGNSEKYKWKAPKAQIGST